jgi:hypothetical protein
LPGAATTALEGLDDDHAAAATGKGMFWLFRFINCRGIGGLMASSPSLQ